MVSSGPPPPHSSIPQVLFTSSSWAHSPPSPLLSSQLVYLRLPRPLLSLTCSSCCSSSLPRVNIDPAKRQTAKTGSVNPSTQGGKTLSKSSAFRFLSAFPSSFTFCHSSKLFLFCPHSIHEQILSSFFLLLCPSWIFSILFRLPMFCLSDWRAEDSCRKMKI